MSNARVQSKGFNYLKLNPFYMGIGAPSKVTLDYGQTQLPSTMLNVSPLNSKQLCLKCSNMLFKKGFKPLQDMGIHCTIHIQQSTISYKSSPISISFFLILFTLWKWLLVVYMYIMGVVGGYIQCNPSWQLVTFPSTWMVMFSPIWI